MIASLQNSLIAVALAALLELAVIARILLRPHRNPASRIAWVVVVGTLPLLGMCAYLLLGEVNIGRRRAQRLREVLSRMPPVPRQADADAAAQAAAVPERCRHLFALGRSISGFDPVGGNAARLLADSNATIDAMVADIDAAITHIASYGSQHTDSIVTENYTKAMRFLREVDSSSVMVNASTRFADGFEYGLGAEIGISTDKIHARGPVGLEGLTSQKFIVLGNGQIRT